MKVLLQSNRTDHIEDIYDLFLWEVEEGYLTLVRTPPDMKCSTGSEISSPSRAESINQHQAYLERR